MTFMLGALLVVLTALGQILLKLGAKDSQSGRLINAQVIAGYLVFALVIFVSYFLMHVTDMKNFTVVMSTSYVAVAIAARVILKERVGMQRILGTVLISIGAVVFLID